MKCNLCNRNFIESEIQLSHDIPKYIGGTDLDGRHWLCKDCHENYDMTILLKCLNYINETYLEDEKILWMNELSKQSEKLKEKFRIIAKKIKEEFYNG